jgi:hypothetical protein
MVKLKYGLSADSYMALKLSQDGCCAICKVSGNLSVDHSHVTGEVRGLLCTKCNTGLGMFQDSIQSLLTAVEYLGRKVG